MRITGGCVLNLFFGAIAFAEPYLCGQSKRFSDKQRGSKCMVWQRRMEYPNGGRRCDRCTRWYKTNPPFGKPDLWYPDHLPARCCCSRAKFLLIKKEIDPPVILFKKTWTKKILPSTYSIVSSYIVTTSSSVDTKDALDEWESAVIDLFLNAANSFGLPKSYGQIYGLLFCRDEPLAMDEVMELLQISKGSASQGLRALRQLGAVSSTYAQGDRKERFVAEIRLRKLISGFLREQADPHLEKGEVRLK